MTIPDKSNMMAYTRPELEAMLVKMRAASSIFYTLATDTGVHPFIEFTGLMNEFIKICKDSLEAGINFPFANTHTGTALAAQEYHIEYIWTKLDCIFGPTVADVLMTKMTGGKYPRAPIQAGWSVVRAAIEEYGKAIATGTKLEMPVPVILAINNLIKSLPAPVPKEAGMTQDEVDAFVKDLEAQIAAKAA